MNVSGFLCDQIIHLRIKGGGMQYYSTTSNDVRGKTLAVKTAPEQKLFESGISMLRTGVCVESQSWTEYGTK